MAKDIKILSTTEDRLRNLKEAQSLPKHAAASPEFEVEQRKKSIEGSRQAGKIFIYKNVPTTTQKLFTIEAGTVIRDIIFCNTSVSGAVSIEILWGTDDAALSGVTGANIATLPNLVFVMPKYSLAGQTGISLTGAMGGLETPIEFNQKFYIYGRAGTADVLDITIIT